MFFRKKWNKKNRDVLYKKAREKWGVDAQILAAIEELSELSVELSKILTKKRDLNNPAHKQKLVDEISDVYIMLEQLMLDQNLTKEVSEHKSTKLEQLKLRIEQ